MDRKQDKKELKDMEEFKARHMRPKRVRINQEDCQFNEQAMKRRRLDQGVATAQIAVPSPDPVEQEPDMDLGLLLLKGEEVRQRDLRMRLEYEKILEQIEVRAKWDHGNIMRLEVKLTTDRGIPRQDAAREDMNLGRGLATLYVRGQRAGRLGIPVRNLLRGVDWREV